MSAAPVLVLSGSLLLGLLGCAERQESDRDIPGGGRSIDYRIGRPYEIRGVWYYPAEDTAYDHIGIASWYGNESGNTTADGEQFDPRRLTAAHKTLPLPVLVRVTNMDNGRSVVLRVNDRGPFASGRIIDVSEAASEDLGFHEQGTARVRVQYIGRADGKPDGVLTHPSE